MIQIGPRIRYTAAGIAIALTVAPFAAPAVAGMIVGTVEYDWSAPLVEEPEPVAPITLKECNALGAERESVTRAWLDANGYEKYGTIRKWMVSKAGSEPDYDSLDKQADACDEWYEPSPAWQYPTTWTEKS